MYCDLQVVCQYLSCDILKSPFITSLPVQCELLTISVKVGNLPDIDFTVNHRNLKELDAELVRKLREFSGAEDGSTDTRSMAVSAFLYIYLTVFARSK